MGPRRRPTHTLADVPVQWFREVLDTLPTVHAVAVAFGVSDNAVRYWRGKLWGVPVPRPVRAAALRAQLLTTLQTCAHGATVAELRCRLPFPRTALAYGLRVLEAQGQVCRHHLHGPRRPGKRLLCWHAVHPAPAAAHFPLKSASLCADRPRAERVRDDV